MNSPTTEKSSTADSHEVRDLVEQKSAKSDQTTHSKLEIDGERIWSSIARLTSNSVDELEKLSTELDELQEFLKSETDRVQREIGSVLAGIAVIIETVGPWKNLGIASAARTNGRDKLKRWPV